MFKSKSKPVLFLYMLPYAGSTATIWSWSTGCVRGDSWKTKHAIAVLGTPHVTAETREEICRILAWDLKQLDVGTYDFVNHTGSFHPLGSAREKIAGETMPLKAVPLAAKKFILIFWHTHMYHMQELRENSNNFSNPIQIVILILRRSRIGKEIWKRTSMLTCCKNRSVGTGAINVVIFAWPRPVPWHLS